MAEKTVKQVCKCEHCGNESEMVITCSLEEIETDEKSTADIKDQPKKAKGHGVYTHCGNEADLWVDL